jgi:hypothetical protein
VSGVLVYCKARHTIWPTLSGPTLILPGAALQNTSTHVTILGPPHLQACLPAEEELVCVAAARGPTLLTPLPQPLGQGASLHVEHVLYTGI